MAEKRTLLGLGALPFEEEAISDRGRGGGRVEVQVVGFAAAVSGTAGGATPATPDWRSSEGKPHFCPSALASPWITCYPRDRHRMVLKS